MLSNLQSPLISIAVHSIETEREWRKGRTFLKSALLKPSSLGEHGSYPKWDRIATVGCIVGFRDSFSFSVLRADRLQFLSSY